MHREPRGLTLPDFRSNPRKTTRFNDHFALSRYAVAADLQHNIQPGPDLPLPHGLVRASHPAELAVARGRFWNHPEPADLTRSANQRFHSVGFEPRLRHDWDGLGGNNTLSVSAGRNIACPYRLLIHALLRSWRTSLAFTSRAEILPVPIGPQNTPTGLAPQCHPGLTGVLRGPESARRVRAGRGAWQAHSAR